MRKFLLTSFFLFLCASVFAQNNVNLNTSDDWVIAATFYRGNSGNCVILLPDLEKTRADFTALTERLKSEEFCYLALDLRGHGYSTNKGTFTDFEKTGQKNEFNKMTEDITAAMKYLKEKGIEEHNVYFLGAGLGANVAGKSLKKYPHIAGIAMLTPSLKQRDVVTLSGIKGYKGPIFIGVSSEDRKQFMEASFIRNAAFLHSGKGKVTFVTAYNLKGTAMLDKYLLPTFIQWLKTPVLPEIKSDFIMPEEQEGQEDQENENENEEPDENNGD